MKMYFDLETCGLSPEKNGIIQLAAIFERDGIEVERVDLRINPQSYRKTVEIDDTALKINKTDRGDLIFYQDSQKAFIRFKEIVEEHGKIVPIGYNSSTFDIPFLKAWFEDNGENYGKYFNYKDVDVFAFVKVLKHFKKFQTKNDKLATICEHFDIEIDAHEAMSDIVATRELFAVLEEKYIV